MIHGLYQQLEKAQARHAMACQAMRDGEPQTCHDAGLLEARLRKEIEGIKQLIDSDLCLIGKLDEVIGGFIPALSTSFRTLALRHVEDAQSRLLRELGDYPPVLP